MQSRHNKARKLYKKFKYTINKTLNIYLDFLDSVTKKRLYLRLQNILLIFASIRVKKTRSSKEYIYSFMSEQ